MCYKQNTDRKGEMQLNRKLKKYIAQLVRVLHRNRRAAGSIPPEGLELHFSQLLLVRSNYQLLDEEVEQNIVICRWRADQLFADAEGRGK